MINNQDGKVKDIIETIRDSPKNKSRVTVEYQFNVEGDLLGSGGYGEVYKVKKKRGTLVQNDPYYALKIFSKINLYKENDKGSRILTEIKIHRSLNHEHICKYEHSFEDKKNVYILMEYCENGTLASYVKTRKYLEEYEIRYYMFQVLGVLKYLRREKIVHRDLTLGNIFLKDLKTVKIGDFGFAYKESENDDKNDEICGTPGYFTPESNNFKYSYKTDIFDFGVCIYYLFGGKLLFRSSSESADEFSGKDFPLERKLPYSEEALDLLTKTVTVENKRIDLDEIYRHPFFNRGKGLSKDKFIEYNENNKQQFLKDIKELIIKEGIILTPHHESKTTFASNTSDGSGSGGILNSGESLHPSLAGKNNSGNQSGKNVSFNVNENSPFTKTIKSGRNSIVYGSGFRGNSKNKENSKNLDIFKENLRRSIVKFQLEEQLKELNNLKNINVSNNNNLNNNNNNNNNIEESQQKNNKIKNDDEPFYFNKSLGESNVYDNDNDNDKDTETILYSSKKNISIENNNYSSKNKIKIEQFIYITDVIDNLNKHCGIGYLLNNKNIGVYFNDNSQMTKIFNNNKYIIYHYKDLLLNKIKNVKIDLPPKDITSDKKKKLNFLVNVIEEFDKNENLKNDNNQKKHKKIIKSENNDDEQDVFLKKYKKTNLALFLILSNKNIQANFHDKTKIIFTCKEPKRITYINKDGETINFPINNNFCEFKSDDVEINKKINYAIKEINK